MSAANRQKRPWKIRLLRMAGALFLLYLLIGFVVLPLAVKFAAPPVAGGAITGGVRIGWVWMNPLSFSVTLRDVALTDAEGVPVLRFDRLHANADPVVSLFSGELTASAFELEGLYVSVVIDEAGSINLLEALAPVDPPEETSEPGEPVDIPAAVLKRFVLENARIDFEDRSLPIPFKHSVASLNIVLNDLRTHATHANEYDFVAVTGADERISVRGRFFLNPLSVVGEADLEGLRLPDYAPFYDDAVNLQVADGRAYGSLRYYFQPLGEDRRLGVEAGAFGLRSVELRPKDGAEPFFQLNRLEVRGFAVDLFAHEARVEAVEIGDGFLRARRGSDGAIDLLGYLLPEATTADPSAPAPARPGEGTPAALEFGVRSDGEDLAKPVNAVLEHLETLAESDWRAVLQSFEFSDFSVELEDAASGPTTIRLDDITLRLGNVTNTPGEAADFFFSLLVNESGRVRLEGSLVPDPVAADLAFEVSDLDLGAFGPVVETFVPLRLESAGFETAGDLAVRMNDEGLPVATVRADTAVRDFSLRLSGDAQPLAAFEALTITGAAVVSEPLSAEIDEVHMVSPRARIDRLEDGSLALMRLLPEEEAEAEAPAPADEDEAAAMAEEALAEAAEAVAALPDIRVGRVLVEDGRIAVHDASVRPRAALVLSELRLLVEDITLEPGTETTLAFSTRFNEAGEIKLDASLAPADPSLRTRALAAISEIPLTAFSPYAADAIGRPITEGTFSGDFDVRVDENLLNAENQLRVQRIRFGSAGSGAGGLPVGVAVAALEDRNGLIRLDVPIRGSLDDPDFQPAQIFMQILRSTITRALTAPLSIAGSLVGGAISGLDVMQAEAAEEADTSRVGFEAGGAELSEQARSTLDLVADFIRERPQAVLALVPSVDPEADYRAQARAMLNERLAEIAAPSRSEGLRRLYESSFGEAPPEDAAERESAAPEGEGTNAEAAPPPDEGRAASPRAAAGDGFYLGAEEARPARRDAFYTTSEASVRETGRRGFYTGESPPAPAARSAGEPRPPGDTGPAAGAPGVAEMERRLLAAFEPDAAFLQTLAQSRLDAVRDYLVESARLPADRLTLPAPGTSPARRGAFVFFEFASDLD
ncbi:MAG: DUF748 domain-containing protein [Opitutales bacterium]|nr:DUF748 domain-containing protein [Opitutales bacterium]